jgi:hypothetical protein
MQFSIFGICYFGLFISLYDWWKELEIYPTEKNENFDNVFTIAATANCYPICELLIQKWTEAGVHDKKEAYSRGLRESVRCGYLQIVRLVIREARLDINMRLEALENVAWFGQADIVRFLTLDTGADVIKHLESGTLKTVLFNVAYTGNVDIFKFLVLDAGINAIPHLEGEYDGSALRLAVYWDHLSAVRFLLLELGEDVLDMHLRCGHLKDVLAQAAESAHTDILELLLLKLPEHIKSQIPDDVYISIWETAVGKGNTRIVELLVREKENLFEKFLTEGSPGQEM